MSKVLVWSPKPMLEYTITMPDGTLGGFGARPVFEGRPGLWNIFWLHSVQVDSLLDWDPAKHATVPGYSIVISECEVSATFVCGAQTLEHLATTLTPKAWCDKLIGGSLYPPIRTFWDSGTNNCTWLGIVENRMVLSRYHVETNGNIIKGNF